MTQRHTSADTSINTLNRVYKNYVSSMPIGTTILDYGCGKYNTNREFAENCGCTWFGYDPYAKTTEENNVAINCEPDYVICSNVLNVIDNDEVIKSIIADIKNMKVQAFFTIYEGNKSGVGKETKKNCWQRNEKVVDYIPMLREFYSTVIRDGNILICS